MPEQSMPDSHNDLPSRRRRSRSRSPGRRQDVRSRSKDISPARRTGRDTNQDQNYDSPRSRIRSPPRSSHRQRPRSYSRSPSPRRRLRDRSRSRSKTPDRDRRGKDKKKLRGRSRSRTRSEDSASSDSSEQRRRKRKKEKRSKRSSRSRERKERKREKKEKKKKQSDSAAQWGKYGIIQESDIFNKASEFHTWLVEERKINPETVSKDQSKKEFAKFVEDFNTATLPHEKYYNMEAYERRMNALRSGEFVPPPEDTYDANADLQAIKGAHKKKAVDQDSYLSKEQLLELRKVQHERVQAGKMKLLGMDVGQNMGVRMDGTAFDE